MGWVIAIKFCINALTSISTVGLFFLGIDRERITYQKPDGSYAAWKRHPTSLW